MKKAITLSLLVAFTLRAEITELDTGFESPGRTTVTALAVDRAGRVLVGSTHENGMIRRLLSDGSHDGSFATNALQVINPEFAKITQIEPRADGKIYVTGNFLTEATFGRNFIARLNEDGTVDESFSPALQLGGSLGNLMLKSYVDPGERVLLCITSREGGGTLRFSGNVPFAQLAWLKRDGSVSHTLAPASGAQNYRKMIYDHAGRLIVAPIPMQSAAPALARVRGSAFDNAFPFQVRGAVYDLLRQGEYLLVAGAHTNTLNSTSVPPLFRIHLTDDAMDSSFQVSANGPVRQVLPMAEGKLLISGDFTTVNGEERGRIAVLNADGSLDGSFNSGAGLDAAPVGIAVQHDGRIVAAGPFTSYNSTAVGPVVRFEGGSSAGELQLDALKLTCREGDGKIVILAHRKGGSAGVLGGRIWTESQSAIEGTDFSGVDHEFELEDGENASVAIEIPILKKAGPGSNRTFEVRLESGGRPSGAQVLIIDEDNGEFDATFTTEIVGAQSVLNDFDVAADGSVFIAGKFTSFRGVAVTNVVRLNSALEVDEDFKLNPPPAAVSSIHLQPDGKVLLGGIFSAHGVRPAVALARYHADGTHEPEVSLNSAGAPGETPRKIITLPNGNIVVTGGNAAITGMGGFGYLLEPDGSAGKKLASAAFEAKAWTETKFLVGQNNTSPTAVYGADSGVITGPFLPTMDAGRGVLATVYALARSRENKWWVGGTFQTVGGDPQWLLTRYDDLEKVPANNLQTAGLGVVDLTFQGPRIGTNSTTRPESVMAIQPLPEGDILIAGRFTMVDGQNRPLLARLSHEGKFIPMPTLEFTGGQYIDKLVWLPQGGVLARGAVTNVNGTVVNGIFKLNFPAPQPPVVAASASASEAQAGETITISAEGYDPDGFIEFVEFRRGEETYVDAEPPYVWELNDVQPGTHTINVRALDEWGSETFAVPVVITVTERPVEEIRLAVSREGEQLRFGFTGRGTPMRIEGSTDLESWQLVQEFLEPAGPTSHSIPLPEAGERFFRLVED